MRRLIDLRSTARALAALLIMLVMADAAQAAELFMFRRDDCPWCAMWDRDIGPIYPKTDIGRRVPVRMLDLDRASAQSIRTRGPVIYTPTFVLVEKGVEVGRIEGYPGEAFFWGRLDSLLSQLPAKGASAPALREEPAL